MKLYQLDNNNDPERLYCALRTTTASCRHTVGTSRPRYVTDVTMQVPVNMHIEEKGSSCAAPPQSGDDLNLTKVTLITHHTLLDRQKDERRKRFIRDSRN